MEDLALTPGENTDDQDQENRIPEAAKTLEDIAQETMNRHEAFKLEKARLKAQTEAFT